MASQDNADTTELEGRYAAPANSFESRLTELETVILAFLGDDPRASGSATWNGPPNRSKSFQSLKEWSAAVTRAPSYASIYLHSGEHERRISIYQETHGIELKVSALDADIDVANATLRQLEEVLALEAAENLSDADRASADREYLFLKPDDPASLIRVLEAAADIAKGNPRTQISVRTRENATIQLRRVDDPRLQSILDTQWDDVIGIEGSMYSNRVSVRVEYRLAESLLFVHVEAADADKVKAHVARLEQVGALEPLPPTSAFKGRKKLFAPKGALDTQWFTRAVDALSMAVPQASYTNCAYRLVDAPTEEVVNRDYHEWSKHVLQEWNRLSVAYCWLDGRAARASMRVDPRREQVELSIEATTDARADAILATLVQDLDLDVVREATPNRRTAASFQITRWGNKQFAKALEAALKRVFSDRVPALEEAYVEELVDDEVDRRAQSDLDAMLSRLMKPEPFAGAGLRAVARDDAIGVYLAPPKTRDGLHTLEIKSSFGPQEFPDLVKIFERQLGLEPLPTANEDDGEPIGAGRSKKGFDWRSAFLPILFTGVLTLLLTSGFWLAVIPTTSLEITIPAHLGDSALVMPADLDSVRLEWVIKRKQFGQTSILRSEEAAVRVLRTSGQEMHSTTGRGRVAVPVRPGPQVIEVSTPNGNESDVLRIVVPAAPVLP